MKWDTATVWYFRRKFPGRVHGEKDAIVIRCDGHGVPELLDAILEVFPLDTYVEHPVNLMEVMPGDDVETPIWDTYKEIVENMIREAETPSVTSRDLLSTMRRKKYMRSSPPARAHSMQTLCSRRA